MSEKKYKAIGWVVKEIGKRGGRYPYQCTMRGTREESRWSYINYIGNDFDEKLATGRVCFSRVFVEVKQ